MLRLGELRAGGKISEDMYQRELAKGEALISYVGMGNISLFDLARTGFRLHSRDRLLLATDGLYRVLDDMKIKEILETESSSLLCANVLINQVLAHAKQQILDNTTFVLIDVL